MRDWRIRYNALFQDHEVFVRTRGHVRFLKISASVQRRVAAVVLTFLALWALVTAGFIVNRILTADERAAVAARQKAAAEAEQRVAAFRNNVEETASDLAERQTELEALVEKHFAIEPAGDIAGEATSGKASSDTAGTKSGSGVASVPITLAPDSNIPREAAALAKVKARQTRLAMALTQVVEQRATKAEQAVRALGLSALPAGQGGPFIPAAQSYRLSKNTGTAFPTLQSALRRLERAESTLLSIPSDNPANVMMMSSGFGHRSDPFTGEAAMHSGLDFRGPIGTPILATASGRVVYAGVRGGYGNTVEIDHGHGIMTRYAHLSQIGVSVGQAVAGTTQIGKMGSTGRSTGSHLHFEVRVNGQAVNPRPFLEARTDVREAKAAADKRIRAVVTVR